MCSLLVDPRGPMKTKQTANTSSAAEIGPRLMLNREQSARIVVRMPPVELLKAKVDGPSALNVEWNLMARLCYVVPNHEHAVGSPTREQTQHMETSRQHLDGYQEYRLAAH